MSWYSLNMQQRQSYIDHHVNTKVAPTGAGSSTLGIFLLSPFNFTSHVSWDAPIYTYMYAIYSVIIFYLKYGVLCWDENIYTQPIMIPIIKNLKKKKKMGLLITANFCELWNYYLMYLKTVSANAAVDKVNKIIQNLKTAVLKIK